MLLKITSTNRIEQIVKKLKFTKNQFKFPDVLSYIE